MENVGAPVHAGLGEGAHADVHTKEAAVLPGAAAAADRWRSMRDAALAAMNKSTTPNTSTSMSGGGGGGARTGASREELAGFDAASHPVRPSEQTAPIFFQQQFRIPTILARRYARLVFLAHYRIDLRHPKKSKKYKTPILDFNEVELIAQIMMRCWAIPIGEMVEDKQVNTAAGTDAGIDGSSLLQPRLQTGDSSNANPSPELSQTPPHQQHQHQRVHGSSSNLGVGSGAAARGFEFIPIVAEMQEEDEDIWVGDVIDMDFVEGVSQRRGEQRLVNRSVSEVF